MVESPFTSFWNAVCLLTQKMCEVVSHPVKVWINSNWKNKSLPRTCFHWCCTLCSFGLVGMKIEASTFCPSIVEEKNESICILLYQSCGLMFWQLDCSFDNIHICITWCIDNSAALLFQLLGHKIVKTLFVARSGKEIILSSHKLSLCIEVNDGLSVFTTSLMRIVFDGRTFTITIINDCCLTIMAYGKVCIWLCNGTVTVTLFFNAKR